MELYLDTVSVVGVERLVRIFSIAGVITSPSTVVTSRESIWNVLPRLQNAISEEGISFTQAISRDAQDIVEETECLGNMASGLVVKIPATSGGPAAIKMLKKENIITLGTATYNVSQGLLAALAGAKYAAPYVNRIDVQGGDGTRTVQELQALLGLHAPNSIIPVINFETPRQTLDCLLAGRETIILPLDVV